MTHGETKAQTDKYPQEKQILTNLYNAKKQTPIKSVWVNNIVGKEHLNENVDPKAREESQVE